MSMELIDEALRPSILSQSGLMAHSQTSCTWNMDTTSEAAAHLDTVVECGQIDVVADRPQANIVKCETIALIGPVDDIRPTHEWDHVFFFPAALKSYLQGFDREINDSKAFSWPFVMRNGSLVLIGSQRNSEAVCLPAICANVAVILLVLAPIHLTAITHR